MVSSSLLGAVPAATNGFTTPPLMETFGHPSPIFVTDKAPSAPPSQHTGANCGLLVESVPQRAVNAFGTIITTARPGANGSLRICTVVPALRLRVSAAICMQLEKERRGMIRSGVRVLTVQCGVNSPRFLPQPPRALVLLLPSLVSRALRDSLLPGKAPTMMKTCGFRCSTGPPGHLSSLFLARKLAMHHP